MDKTKKKRMTRQDVQEAFRFVLQRSDSDDANELMRETEERLRAKYGAETGKQFSQFKSAAFQTLGTS